MPDSHPQQMDDISSGLKTKSDKIRALAKAGFSRADIARYLDIRYQHVRNVLVHDEQVSGKVHPVPERPGRTSEPPRGGGGDPSKARVGPDGTITISPGLTRALGLEPGDPVIVSADDGCIRIMSLDASVRRAQALLRKIIPPDVDLVADLLSERRQEAAREDHDA